VRVEYEHVLDPGDEVVAIGVVRGTGSGRIVYMLPELRDELDSYRVRQEVDPDALVFGTQRGKAVTVDKVRRRILAKAREQAARQ
jgi:hypothetical protein